MFEASDCLETVRQFAMRNGGFGDVDEFALVYGGRPPKKFTENDRDTSLEELNLCPSVRADQIGTVQKRPFKKTF